jgi:hypothetical protein
MLTNPVLTHTSLPCARLADQELQAFRLANMAYNHQMKLRLSANRLSRATSEFNNHAALLEAALVLTLRMGPPDVTCSSHLPCSRFEPKAKENGSWC